MDLVSDWQGTRSVNDAGKQDGRLECVVSSVSGISVGSLYRMPHPQMWTHSSVSFALIVRS